MLTDQLSDQMVMTVQRSQPSESTTWNPKSLALTTRPGFAQTWVFLGKTQSRIQINTENWVNCRPWTVREVPNSQFNVLTGTQYLMTPNRWHSFPFPRVIQGVMENSNHRYSTTTKKIFQSEKSNQKRKDFD